MNIMIIGLFQNPFELEIGHFLRSLLYALPLTPIEPSLFVPIWRNSRFGKEPKLNVPKLHIDLKQGQSLADNE